MTTDSRLSGAVHRTEPAAGPADRPLSRRALREQERRRAAVVTPDGWDDDGLLPDEPQRYTVWHVLALAAVGAGFGALIWTLASSGEATGAASVHPTPALSASPAAHRGEP